MVRINGVLPDITKLSNLVTYESSERAREIGTMGQRSATSCSIINLQNDHKVLHILVDIGPGVVNSIQQIPNSDLMPRNISYLPNVLLITHYHDDHIMDLPLLLSLYDTNRTLKIYCTKETKVNLFNRFQGYIFNSNIKFIEIMPGQSINMEPFNITPLSVNHFDYDKNSSVSGSVIYVIRLNDTKIVIAWDFLTINTDIDQRLLWNPDLLILGTETFNSHPSTGMISVEDAIVLARRWNAKNSYVLHYSGLMDIEDGKNQWFRGPTKSMTSSMLQQSINEQLKMAGDDGKFKLTVAAEGSVWLSNVHFEQIADSNNLKDENPIEVESLQKYIFEMEKREQDKKLSVVIEDRVNRYSLEFDNPTRNRTNEDIVYGKSVKGMLTKGPELKMEIHSDPEINLVRIEVLKGKKFMFKDDIALKDIDIQRLRKFIHQYIPAQ
jgi:phosphoribosyl 1,2-cyclic phosphodiesterase